MHKFADVLAPLLLQLYGAARHKTQQRQLASAAQKQARGARRSDWHSFSGAHSGSVKVTVKPAPSTLVTSTLPPNSSLTMLYTMFMPRPDPPLPSLVVKNGSKIRRSTVSDTPTPSSEKLICAVFSSTKRLVMHMTPESRPSKPWSKELFTRLVMTWPSEPG